MTFDKLKSQKEDQNPLADDALSLSKWEEKKLGEVCEILDRLRKPITKKDRIEGDYPYYGATGILSYVDNYIFSEKLVLIGEDGAKWQSGDNTAFIVDGKYWVNNHAHVIRPNRKIIVDDWIVYYLNFSDLTSFITGVTVPKLNQEKMRDIKIPLPPLSEQKKIVEVLDQAFAGIEQSRQNTKQNLKNAKEIFESYLQGVFENKGDDWEEKNLGEVCEVIAGQSPEGKFYNTVGEGLPFYQGKKEYGEKYIRDPKTWTKKVTKEAFAGDILMSVRAPVGPVNFVTQKICIGRGLVSIRAGDLIDKEFLFYFLNNKEKELEGNSGAVFNSINKDQIKQIPIPLPPLSEQKKIVQELDALRAETQKLEAIYTQKLNDLDELKKSLLQKAFAGELVK